MFLSQGGDVVLVWIYFDVHNYWNSKRLSLMAVPKGHGKLSEERVDVWLSPRGEWDQPTTIERLRPIERTPLEVDVRPDFFDRWNYPRSQEAIRRLVWKAYTEKTLPQSEASLQ